MPSGGMSGSDGGSDAYFGFSSKVALIFGIVVLLIAIISGSLTAVPDRIQDLFSNDTQSVLLYIGAVCLIVLAALTAGACIFAYVTAKLRGYFRERRSLNSVLLEIKVPRETETLSDAAEAVFNGLYSIFNAITWTARTKRFFLGQEQVSLEIVANGGLISFYTYATEDLSELLERQIYAQYPDADIHRVKEYNLFAPGCKAVFAELCQSKDPAYPIRSYRDLAKEAGTQQLKEITIDTLSILTNAMSKLEEGESAAIQLIIRPVGRKWQKKGSQIIHGLYGKTRAAENKPGEQMTSGEQEAVRAIENTISKPGFESVIRLVTTASTDVKANLNLSHIIAAFEQLNTVDYNRLNRKRKLNKNKFFTSFIFRYFPIFNFHPNPWLLFVNPILHRQCGQLMIFNTEELASLYHLPNKLIGTPQIDWLKAKRAPSPVEVPTLVSKAGMIAEVKEDVITPDRSILGFNLYRGKQKEVCILREDKRRHIYSIGRTGMGKSVFMENQIYQDIANGEGVCVVDPHGDLARKCLSFVPKSRIEDVVYFDPSDIDRPMGLNMLEFDNPEQKDFAVQEMVAILYKLFADFIGPRFEHIVRNSMLAIMDHPDGGTLVEMMRILTDDDYRDECLEHVTNPLVRAFWQEEMAQQVQFHKSEMLGPVLSKFGRFVSNDMMRNIIGQTKSSFNIREIMDKKKILLINLAKGKVGDINCNLMGMIIVSKILMAALARTDMPEDEREDFYLYVDEFQNFATESFATILSEARKYHLNLNVTHQYVGQLKEEIQKAVFGNVGTFISFRIGAPDAELVTKEFKPQFDETDLLNLEKYTCYVKLLVDGVATKPFSMHTYPPVHAKGKDHTDQIIQLSRLRYGRGRKEVDEEIRHRGRFDMML